MAQTSGLDPKTQVKTCLDCKMFDVANWVACLNGENGPGGTPSHEALSVSPQGALEISSVTGQPPSLDRSHCSTLRLVAKSLKRDERCRPSSQRPQYPTLYRHLKRRLGRSLRSKFYQGPVVRLGKKATHKRSRIECGLPGLVSRSGQASLWRWQRELLPLRGHQQGPSTSQSVPYLRNCAEKIGGFLHSICETYLHHIAQSSDLHRLLSSFHRDRPKSSRNLPKWNLSVVLNELTKAPFEPMKDTDLKHLTLKTAFLLALASGKRRSQIHAWVANKVSNLGQWEKVALFPSDFIAKNQLAREGSQSVSPVTIPA